MIKIYNTLLPYNTDLNFYTKLYTASALNELILFLINFNIRKNIKSYKSFIEIEFQLDINNY